MTKKETKKTHKKKEETKKVEEKKASPGLESIPEKTNEYLEGWKRIKAEFDNYRKDEQKRMQDMGIFFKAGMVLEILPTLDSFEEAIKQVPEKDKESDWVKGLLKIRDQLLEILKKHDIKEMEVLGKEFDPYFHEAVGEAVGKEENKDKIIQVLQKGYLMGDRVIRPARVYVGK
ncbi:MAG: nucleotide exchange factor GrpE [Candidatus Paceibacterota bacterium]|jgi:molecular chaperone GrpE